jgi:hypothetical protein
MSTPDQDTQTKSFADTVNEAVSQMTQGEDGKWSLPDSVDKGNEALVYAVNSERRRRDTQAAYTRTSQEKARLEAENKHLAEGWQKDFSSSMTTEQQAELEELKVTDPEAWRIKLNELENARQAKFNETRTSIQQKAVGESELDYRQRALQEFSEAHPDLKLTDDVIQNDIPPRLTKQLENGEVTFGAFLDKVAEYMTKGRVVKPTEEVPNGGVDLGKAAGGSLPDGNAIKEASKTQYNDEIY